MRELYDATPSHDEREIDLLANTPSRAGATLTRETLPAVSVRMLTVCLVKRIDMALADRHRCNAQLILA